jgi:hypothetical protein
MNRAFITNNETRTLKKRLEQLIQHSQELKFLVERTLLSPPGTRRPDY